MTPGLHDPRADAPAAQVWFAAPVARTLLQPLTDALADLKREHPQASEAEIAERFFFEAVLLAAARRRRPQHTQD